MKIISIAAVAALSLVLAGCNGGGNAAPAKKTTQADKAKKAADSISFNENAEIDNIKRRLELTSAPGALGYILLMNAAGQPIAYHGVKGKITSGGKRLTPPVQLWRIDRGDFMGSQVGPAPSDEGTWGSSSPYIYFWTTSGQYMQWSGDYLYSDKPFRLRVEPLVVSVAPTEG